MDRDNAQGTTTTESHLLPRHYIGVVLHRTNDNLIPRLEELHTIGRRDQVKAFCSTSREKDFPAIGSYKLGYSGSCSLMSLRGLSTQTVDPAVYIGVTRCICLYETVNYHLRLLCGSGII